MRAFIVSVGYDDLLSVTLPYNRQHFTSIVVVTSTANCKSIQTICAPYKCDIVVTDAFYDDGADFNKWKALEYALDLIGRRGEICLLDADIIWPKKAVIYPECGKLYVPRRRIIPTEYIRNHGVPSESEWDAFDLFREIEYAGYSQIFHADDPVLVPKPWHKTNWRHAGGADSFFQMRWKAEDKIRPDFEVLHIGKPGINWCGRVGELINGELPDGYKERQDMLQYYLCGRKGKRANNRYNHEKLGS